MEISLCFSGRVRVLCVRSWVPSEVCAGRRCRGRGRRSPGKPEREPGTVPNGKTFLKHSDISKSPHWQPLACQEIKRHLIWITGGRQRIHGAECPRLLVATSSGKSKKVGGIFPARYMSSSSPEGVPKATPAVWTSAARMRSKTGQLSRSRPAWRAMSNATGSSGGRCTSRMLRR